MTEKDWDVWDALYDDNPSQAESRGGLYALPFRAFKYQGHARGLLPWP
jgi:hypothetical protein